MNKNTQLVLGVVALVIVGALIYVSTPKSDSQAPDTNTEVMPKRTVKNDSALDKPQAEVLPQGQQIPLDIIKQNSNVTYNCTGGKSFSMNFATDGHSTTTLTLNDASGKKSYPVTPKIVNKVDPAFTDEKSAVTFVNKGNYAYVEVGGKTTYDQCKSN